MAVLSSKQILQEKNTNDPNSITALTLTHKALSDVSCLREFKNLERLDLGFNSLTSLEGLSSCENLKWLSVVQNKLESLKGIEGLTRLHVLNAGKNKLKSMDEVRSLVTLRALILNENEIVSICKLDQMKELNTLVLSRNPISDIGEALVKTKAMTKLSLSNCQIQSIGSSLKSCTELKELRLSHNDIKTLPVELAHNTKLQNLDLGNNLIAKWSDLKVLSSLVNLKNLNLQGNPIAEKESLPAKVKTVLPFLHVFNARPANKTNKRESDITEDSPIDYKEPKKRRLMDQSVDMSTGNMEESNKLAKEEASNPIETGVAKNSKKKNKLKQNKHNVLENVETPSMDPDVQIEVKRQKQKTDKHVDKEGADRKKSKGKVKQRESDVLDDGEIPFTELFTNDVTDTAVNGVNKRASDKPIQGINPNDGIVTLSTKQKKHKKRGSAAAALQLTVDAEVGLGGPSTW